MLLQKHDTSYSTSFTARGNVTAVSRWDVNDINNQAKRLTSFTNYYTTGTPASSTDPSGHQNSVTYTDSFSDGLVRNTFAYPTTLTDADNFSSFVQYNFDFGATTRTQSPAPEGQSQGAIQTLTYNNLGQLERITTTNNNAYKRFWYGAEFTASYISVNNVADEAYSIEVTDGLGRVIGGARNHPGSTGGYSLINTIYDQMGRVWLRSNPTEVNNSWVTSGDDAAGIYYTQQTYDWQGRPLVTTHPDLTTKYASYSGCGCAGGEVVTLTDEGTIDAGVAKRRQRKIYSDVLGRTVKTEILNWQAGSVYSATVNTYNVLNQVTQIRQYAGQEGSGTYQDTTMTYDGYGRLKTQHVPEQNAGTATVWTYNSDDTINSITDARNASVTYTYNGRHKVTDMSYSAPWPITVPYSVSYSYDAAGNRTKLNDGFGNQTYQYDQLSRLTQESRQFPVGTFSITYSYNLAGKLSGLTDPFGAGFTYTRDVQGQSTALTGTPYAGFTNYITDVQYRAWGAPKSIGYSGSNSTIAYNSRMQPTQFRLTVNGTGASIIREDYGYFADGTLRSVTDLDDTAGSNPPVTLRFLSRAFRYDQVGRVTGSFGTGSAGQGVPFDQNYTYDQFGNTTARSGKYYNYNFSAPNTDTATYTNKRRGNWSYNAEGQVISTPSTSTDPPRTITYDAAGRMMSTIETGPAGTVTYSPAYDGDGNLVRESSSGSSGTQLSYIVRSTVLGGEVLTRLDASGNKLITHVPAEGLLFATQRSSGAPGAFVMRTHRNPLGIAETNKGVYDPLGNYIPFSHHGDPRPPVGSYNSAAMGGLSSSQANPDNYAVGCVMDGMPTDCNRVMHALGRDQAESVSIHGVALSPLIMRLMSSFMPVTYTRTLKLEEGGISDTITPGGDEGHFEGGYSHNYASWVITRFIFAPGSNLGFEQRPEKTAMDIAREKNCATPNSLVEQFKREFESLWEKTASPRSGVEGEEHAALVFYEAATNSYPFVELSPGKHIRMGKSQYAPSVPAMPNVGPETREARAAFSKSNRAVNFFAFFHTHPNYVGLPPESRSGDPTQEDKDYQRAHGNPLGIIRTGKGYSFFSNGKTFGPGDAKANNCIWQLNRARN